MPIPTPHIEAKAGETDPEQREHGRLGDVDHDR